MILENYLKKPKSFDGFVVSNKLESFTVSSVNELTYKTIKLSFRYFTITNEAATNVSTFDDSQLRTPQRF